MFYNIFKGRMCIKIVSCYEDKESSGLETKSSSNNDKYFI